MRRIEFCGGIGSGKSTIARMLAALRRAHLVEEHYEQVPFWREYYAEPEQFGIEKNISFLLFHCNAIRNARRHLVAEPIICDFALFQDMSYTRLNCSAEEYIAVSHLYDRMQEKVGLPEVVVHASCSLAEQIDRIRIRGRTPELGLTPEYLEMLAASIVAELAIRLPGVPVIEVNTSDYDFVANPTDSLNRLIQQLSPFV